MSHDRTPASKQPMKETVSMNATPTIAVSPRSLGAHALLVLVAALLAVAFSASAAQAKPQLNLVGYDAGAYNQDGSPATQAGEAPWELRTAFSFDTTTEGPAGNLIPGGNLKDTTVELPAGAIGNPAAIPQCRQELLEHTGAPLCPTNTQVGVAEIDVTLYSRQNQLVPVYNMVPPPGQPAQFGFIVIAAVTHVDVKLRGDGDYGVSARVHNINAITQVYGVTVRLWGVPADPSHDALRFAPGSPVQGGVPIPSDQPRLPFLRNPTSCLGPQVTTLDARSWQEPDRPLLGYHGTPGMTGCNELGFEPAIDAQPTTNRADTTTGLDFHLHIPQNQDPDGTATAHLRDSRVALPPSLNVNPSSANGLGACDLSQIGYLGKSDEKQFLHYELPRSDSFTIDYEGATTSPISASATTAEVKAAIETLPGLAGNISLEGEPGDWIVTFTGALAGSDVATLAGTVSDNSVQGLEVTGSAGSFNLQLGAASTEVTFESSFENGSTFLTAVNPSGTLRSNDLLEGPGIAPGTRVLNVYGGSTLELSKPTTAKQPPVDGDPSVGLTTSMPFDVSASRIQQGLEDFPALGAGNVFVSATGASGYTHYFQVVFAGALAGTEPDLLNVTSTLSGPGAGVLVSRPAPTRPLEVGTNVFAGNPRFDKDPDNCPNAAKIGTVRVDAPAALAKPLEGNVYLATPHQNPFGSLLAMYIVAEGSGIRVKLPGLIEADPKTGQLTATVSEAPQLSFEDLELDFFKGAAAPLKTGIACGTYDIETDMVPWSSPEGATKHPTDSFTIDHGAGNGPCVKDEAAAPNKPSFEAGTVDPIAGAYSPFNLKLTRADGTQQLTGIDTTLPKGLIARLAGTPYCSDAALASAASKDGKAEQANPSCPAASRVGSVTVGAGAGPTPFYAQGAAYLAGPYKGAPLSLAVVTPAVAGPFDLGTVIVRNALYVNPETTQVRAVSDPFPAILEGIPLDLRSVVLNLDKPQFTKNPTSCNPFEITGAAMALTGQSVALNNHFQVGDCAKLKFAPKLKLSLKGGTKRSDYPALKAILTARGGEANIGRAAVTLPKSEYLENAHIRTICTRVQYAAKACPARSIYGYAKAWSPLLDEPLRGPVYLRSSDNKLPDLVASLDGQIHVDLVGRIDSPNARLRTTFDAIPDAPVSKFVLEMQGGKKGLLVNNRNLCKSTNRATVLFDGQNGKKFDTRPVVADSCKQSGKKSKRRAGH